MEPNYVGANKHIDAMAVAWLFAQDCVFFNPDEITWDGTHHGIGGAQINAEKVNDIPTFMENAGMYYQGIGDLLMTLEQDEELIVPRGKIHPGLHDAIREGDLTGITLFNLQACARAFQFLGDENEGVKRNMLEMAGLGDLADNPNAMACTYVIAVDQRLTRGIPGFYQLIRRMFEDMRAYNGIDLPYILLFTAARNVDADQCLDYFDDAVEGAVSETFHVETNMEEWKASHENGEEAPDESGGDEAEGEEEVDERSAMISMLRLFVLTGELGGNAKFPQELLDELDRAENGDTTIDLDDLASRLNECVPDSKSADLSSITFEQGLTAKGRRFTVAVPDGWTAIENYEESTFLGSSTRPFVIVQGEPDDMSNLQMQDRIIYSDIGGDVEVAETYAECGTYDLKWALTLMTRYDKSDNDGLMGMRPNVVWDDEVEAVNTRCFVSQNQPNEGANGLEVYVNPYALDHNDALRFVFTYDGEESVEPVRELAKAIARTVKLDKPVLPECEQTLARALAGKISVGDFTGMVESFVKPYVGLRQSVFTSSQYKYATNTDNFDEDECTLAGAWGIAEFNRRAASTLDRLMDAYDVQIASGLNASNSNKLLESLRLFCDNAMADENVFDASDARKIKSAGVFNPTEEITAVRNRLEDAESHRGATSSSSTSSPQPIKEQREKKTISEPHSTAAIPRIEKALNEKVSASYFIETSEIAAGALMSARQAACDSVTNSWNSDEDNVTAMAREFAKFNTIICRYYGYFVDALEAQVELGNDSSEIRKMANEVNEFSELVADSFSCGNAYLDSVANSCSPVRRPAEYSGIHARWQKVSAR